MSGYIGNAPVPQATQTRQTFTATSGQTSFATVGYVAGGQFIQVYLNGVLLKLTDDYTAANGSDIVLTSGAATGDILEFITFADFTVNNQNFTGNLTVDTDTLYVDSANNRVGIGNASPTQALDVTGDIITSGGVYLGGTGSANKISDYETGTWTPTTTGGTTAVTHNIQGGNYTKIGNLVVAKFRLTFTSITGDANFYTIGGLPFTVAAGVGASETGGTAPMLDNLTATVDNITIQPGALSSQFIFIVNNGSNGSHSGLRGNQLTAGTDIRGTVIYFAA